MRLRELPASLRPRERLQSSGPQALSEAELLAILLQTGSKNENVLDLANIMLLGGLEKLFSSTLHELCRIEGIGIAKGSRIIAAIELAQRNSRKNFDHEPITCAQDVFSYAEPKLRNDKEYLMVILLDTKYRIICDDIVAIGSLSSLIVHPREVFRYAIRNGAHAVIVVHTHPSGDPSPSCEDVLCTEKLRSTGHIIGIEVIDHVIIGDECYYSFQEHQAQEE